MGLSARGGSCGISDGAQHWGLQLHNTSPLLCLRGLEDLSVETEGNLPSSGTHEVQKIVGSSAQGRSG